MNHISNYCPPQSWNRLSFSVSECRHLKADTFAILGSIFEYDLSAATLKETDHTKSKFL